MLLLEQINKRSYKNINTKAWWKLISDSNYFWHKSEEKDVAVVVFQIAFRVEIHINGVFLFFKIIFDISILKRFKKYKPHSILTKKNLKFDQTQV